MLNSISWASYVYAVGLIVVVYYVFIGLFFYRSEAVKYFNNSKAAAYPDANHVASDEQMSGAEITAINEVNAEEEVLKSLLLTIKKAASQQFIKEELVQSLKGQIQLNVGRAGELPKEKINQYITETSEKYCSIHLSVTDLNMLWGN